MTSEGKASSEIYAQLYWNSTGVMLRPGYSYQFSATGSWWDAVKKCCADGYPKGNFVQELARNLRRSPENDWFALVGAVNRDLSTRFLIGLSRVYDVPEKGGGELFCFANDVPGFYWNNFGYVTLTTRQIS